METWAISVVVLMAIRFVSVWPRFVRPKRTADIIWFNVTTPLQVAEVSVFGILLGTIITPVIVGTWRSDWWQMLLAGGCTILAALFLPTAILTDSRGASQKGLLRSRFIAWGNVDSIMKDPRRQEIVVTSKNCVRIVHNSFHVAPSEFLREVENRSSRHSLEMSDIEF